MDKAAAGDRERNKGGKHGKPDKRAKSNSSAGVDIAECALVALLNGDECHVFHAELEKLIPGLRIVEAASRIDTTAFRSADIFFLQINKTNHSNYWSVCDTAKNAGVPYYHLNFANARRCAEEMVKRIKGLDYDGNSSGT